MTKNKLTETDLINWWLKKYHKTDLEEVKRLHPDWGGEDFDSRIFYEAYPVTQEQHDEWYAWALSEFRRAYRMSKKMAERQFCFIYLNSAPYIIGSTM